MPHSIAGFGRWLLCAGVLALQFAAASGVQAAEPLHERIDQLLEASSLGPLAGPANDGDFLRRVYLDLTGVIPSAEAARAFLADQDPLKRAQLIDRLLAGPRYARHMAYLFNAMLTERRPARSIKPEEWHEFLRQSFAANKPYDQLAREILSADGSDGPLRPAAVFYLARLAQPEVLTRDVGRVFFGVDLQCAQCHDHPLIDNYHQADYYGLFAFLSRSSIFTDAKSKQSLVADKADGEVNFKSVFTGFSADKFAPRLLKGPPISEPTFAAGEEYAVKPAKDVRPVPKFSRRAELARLTTSGQSAAFSRNIANRLWTQMFGCGFVQPVDLDHPDNPPSHPQLLALLADEFVRMRYDVRAMLRELALTRAYQRSCDPPEPQTLNVPEVARRLPACEAEAAALATTAKSSQDAAAKIRDEWTAARTASADQTAQAVKLEADEAAARKAQTSTEKDLAAARTALAAKEEAAAALAEAIAKTKVALEKLSGDAVLTQAVGQLETRRGALIAEGAEAAKLLVQRAAAVDAGAARLAACRTALLPVRKAQEQLRLQEAALLAAENRAADDKTAASAAEKRLAEARAILDYARLAEQAVSSQSAGDAQVIQQAWNGLVDGWTRRFTCRAPTPLTPEELAWSLLEAVGQVGEQEQTIALQLKKSPPAGVNPADPAQVAAEMEKGVYAKLQTAAGSLVATFSSGPGQSDYEFQPSVSQALFMTNAAELQTTLVPNSDNLVARLLAMTDNNQLADELYLVTLARLPDAQERADVAAYFQDRDCDRPIVIQELAWALLTSTEFRFNR